MPKSQTPALFKNTKQIGAIQTGLPTDSVVCTENPEHICVYMGGEKL